MAEEKLAVVYERRTTATSTLTTSTPGTIQGASDATSEEQLRSKVAEVRGALQAAKVDLETSRNHIAQFQDISQASEAALQSPSASHEEYKTSTEAQLAKHDAEAKSVEGRIASMQQEIDRINAKNGELQQALEKEKVARKALEDTIVDITNAEANSRTDQASRENDIREQMERAKAAEEKYSREVLAHAESIKAVETLKKDLKEALAFVREKTMSAETAQANFASSETSWKQQRLH